MNMLLDYKMKEVKIISILVVFVSLIIGCNFNDLQKRSEEIKNTDIQSNNHYKRTYGNKND